MTDHPTDWIKDAGWYTELRKTARIGADAEFDAMLARLLSEHARSAIEATADTGLRERVEALADDLWRVAPCGCGHRADLHTMGGLDGVSVCTGRLGICGCDWSFVRIVQQRIRDLLATAAPTTDTGGCATCSGRGVWMDEPCHDCASGDTALTQAVRAVLDAEQAWSGNPDELGPLTQAVQRLRDAYTGARDE